MKKDKILKAAVTIIPEKGEMLPIETRGKDLVKSIVNEPGILGKNFQNRRKGGL